MRRRLVVANWKMHKTPTEAAAFAATLLRERDGLPPGVTVAIAPAFPALERLSRMLGPLPVLLAAQDVHGARSGAFTGEVSAAMLADLGVTLCLVGHSERRRDRLEGPALAGKLERLAEAGIAPVLCVGETLEERESGRTEEVLTKQVAVLDAFPAGPPPGLVLAYEPVWAIGTGRAATPALAGEAHAVLRGLLAARYGRPAAESTEILYGGSVTPQNAAELLARPEIDGGLVGGAALEVAGLLAIAKAASP